MTDRQDEPIYMAAMDLCADAVAIVDTAGRAIVWQNAAFGHWAEAVGKSSSGENGGLGWALVNALAAAASDDSETTSVAGRTGKLKFIAQPAGTFVAAVFSQTPDVLDATPPPPSTDLVTGLPDRRALQAELDRRFGVGTGAGSFALLFIDLNGFKQVNDTLGHVAGDRTLSEIARRMQSTLRDHDFVARFGGDEFVVLVAGIGKRQSLDPIVARLETAVALPLPDTGQLSVSASIGVAVSADNYATPEAMLSAADQDMYRRKRANSTGV